MSHGRLTLHITELTAGEGSSTFVFCFRPIYVCFSSETSATKTLVTALVHPLVATKLLLVPSLELGPFFSPLTGATHGASRVGAA